MAVLTRTEKCPRPRIQTFLFLASSLEKNADRCNAHKEGYTKIFKTELLGIATRGK